MGRINTRDWQRHLPHFQSEQRTYSVTFTTRKRYVLSPEARSAVLNHILFDHMQRMVLHAAVVMPDHVHMALTPMADVYGTSMSLSKIVGGIKGSASRRVNQMLCRTGHLWLHESYDREVRHEEDLWKICEYICNNPVRAGLVERVDDYPWIWRESVEGRNNGRLRGGPT